VDVEKIEYSPQHSLSRPSYPLLLGCGVTFFVVFNSSLFGLLDHFYWALFFRIWAREYIAQLGFLCVWLGLEESFFFLQLQCFACCPSFGWHGSFPRILGVAVRLSDQFHVAHKFFSLNHGSRVFYGCCLISWKLFFRQLLSLGGALLCPRKVETHTVLDSVS